MMNAPDGAAKTEKDYISSVRRLPPLQSEKPPIMPYRSRRRSRQHLATRRLPSYAHPTMFPVPSSLDDAPLRTGRCKPGESMNRMDTLLEIVNKHDNLNKTLGTATFLDTSSHRNRGCANFCDVIGKALCSDCIEHGRRLSLEERVEHSGPESFICNIVAPHLADLLSPRQPHCRRIPSSMYSGQTGTPKLDQQQRRHPSERLRGQPTAGRLPRLGLDKVNGHPAVLPDVHGLLKTDNCCQGDPRQGISTSIRTGGISIDENANSHQNLHQNVSVRPSLSRLPEVMPLAPLQPQNNLQLAGRNAPPRHAHLESFPEEISPTTFCQLPRNAATLPTARLTAAFNEANQRPPVYKVGLLRSNCADIIKYPESTRREECAGALVVPQIARCPAPKHPSKLSEGAVLTDGVGGGSRWRGKHRNQGKQMAVGQHNNIVGRRTISREHDEHATWRTRAELFRMPDKL